MPVPDGDRGIIELFLISPKEGQDLMRYVEPKRFGCILLLVPLLFFLTFCASRSGLVGKWKEVGKSATMEFSKDGTFKAVDNQGMAVSGTYTLSRDGQLRCEIRQKEGAGEIVNLKVSIRGDGLALTSSDSSNAEHYRREK